MAGPTHPDFIVHAIDTRQLHPTRFQDPRCIQFLSAEVTAVEAPVEQTNKRPQPPPRVLPPAEDQAQDLGQPSGDFSPIPDGHVVSLFRT